MNHQTLLAHMDVAERYAELSKAKRLKVGTILVKNDRIISIGYNGTPKGWDNDCEFHHEDGSMTTRPEVIHAEANAVAKAAKCGEPVQDAAAFVTHSPCMECAKTLAVSGIRNLYFRNHYRNTDGIDFLDKYGVEVYQLTKKGDLSRWQDTKRLSALSAQASSK